MNDNSLPTDAQGRPKCRFCDDLAVAKYAVNKGCMCYHNDREQYLCFQHIVKANPIESMVLLEDYTIDKVIERGIAP
jgi:hypothetical protein